MISRSSHTGVDSEIADTVSSDGHLDKASAAAFCDALFVGDGE